MGMLATYLVLALVTAQAPETETAVAPTHDPPREREEDSLVIISDSDCPTREAILEALARLRDPGEWPEATVAIRNGSQTLFIDIGPDDPIQRQLVAGPDCSERASSAALVIATWMDDLPGAATSAPVLAAPVLAKVPAPRAPSPYEIGAGLAAAAGGGWAPAMHIEVTRRRDGRWLGWRASLGVVGPRDVSVDNGVTRWMRSFASLGLDARRAFQRFFLAADLGLAGAYTYAWGTGYDQNHRDSAVTWGAEGGVRAGIPWRRLRLWTDLHLRRWLRGDIAQIDSTAASGEDSARLPAQEAQWSIGVSYALP